MPGDVTHGQSAHPTDLADAAARYLPGGSTRATLFVPPRPPYAFQGEGCYLVDTQGHRVIDANNNYTSLIHGHRHPELAAAVRDALDGLWAVGLPTESEVTLATALAGRFPGMELWRFANSGSEAVALALRIARAATGRNQVVRFEGSYHGSSDQVTDHQAPGVGAGASGDTIAVPLEDLAAVEQVFHEQGGHIAAVLIDLMPNRAGMRLRSSEFVDSVSELARRHGALLVVDEVMTARLALGGLQSRFSVTPDITVLGKIIGGGLPIGAVGGRREVMEAADPNRGRHVSWGGTFNANVLSMTAGLRAVELYTAAEVDRLNDMGEALRTQLTGSGLRVAGHGSLMRVLAEEPDRAWWAAYEEGVLLGTNGLLCLSTPMTTEVVESIAERLHTARSAFTSQGDNDV